MEARNEPGDEGERNAVDHENEQPEREERQRQRQNHENRPDHGIDEAEEQCGNEQCAGTGYRHARQQLIRDPQAERGDQQPNNKSFHTDLRRQDAHPRNPSVMAEKITVRP